ncbi:hypothetical protein FH609_010710 [Streptomyces sp. 3MP-14]|uniref:MaoC-like domain-containing protein n=2 Tax=Streptomyces TaxID=1883 RepID=A0A5N6AH32_9ACTN|nr:hypothetical protein FH607_006710 [Streptomyces mimosae]KAB8177712.1 hypothetical protein FH609_010710 [Streptomyces sp. 3MP-14]
MRPWPADAERSGAQTTGHGHPGTGGLSDGTGRADAGWPAAGTEPDDDRGAGARDGVPPAGTEQVNGNEPTVTERWALAADLGRAYARVSGDRNPIHLHPLTARPFGFRRPIAHGMWTAARALAALDEVLPEAFTVNVRFRAPAQLPSHPTFHAAPTHDGGHAFRLTAATGRPLLTGEITPPPPP